jgi:hypothetical protein
MGGGAWNIDDLDDYKGKGKLMPKPTDPPEPSGLWAWWNDGLEDCASPWLAIESKPSWIHAVQLPASMTAREIAALRVGDCRRMKGE